MLYGVLKTLLHISPAFLDLSDPYPGHGGRSCGRFFPHPGHGLSMSPRGADKMVSTQNVLPTTGTSFSICGKH